MIYNLYQTLFDQSEVLIKVDNQLNNILKQKLFFIEEEIAKEFLSKQKGRIGIKSLGNEIRYNKLVKNILKKTYEEEGVLIKMTENKRSFLNVFFSSLYAHPKKNIYFLIFSRVFGEKSKLVDKSFADITHITNQLRMVSKSFKLTDLKRKIFFIEIEDFSNYYFESIENKYSKIHKL